MSKRVLLLAFHFPPLVGTSGVQRAYSMARYLPDYGWEPIVLTASEKAYERTAPDLVDALPDDMLVSRAFALDSARHLSVMGRYFDATARPDRWISWWPAAVRNGLQIIREHRPQVVWSTYPIATAHLIGSTLHKRTKVPWVADFRDSMTEENYPSDPKTRSMFRKIERKTVSNASFVILTSPGTRKLYADRYPREDDSKWQLIENGYDEDAFQSAQSVAVDSVRDCKLTILHSGVIYPKERDPTKFFQAISNLESKGILRDRDVEFRLRATGHDDYLRQQIDRIGIHKLVKLCEPVPYREALAEMMSCAGLLLLQAASCNHQTPAKVYEYIRAGRPILALTDSAGDTAELIQKNNLGLVAPLDSTEHIEKAIQKFLAEIVGKNITRPEGLTESFSRRAQVGKTAQLFDQLTGNID